MNKWSQSTIKTYYSHLFSGGHKYKNDKYIFDIVSNKSAYMTWNTIDNNGHMNEKGVIVYDVKLIMVFFNQIFVVLWKH